LLPQDKLSQKIRSPTKNFLPTEGTLVGSKLSLQLQEEIKNKLKIPEIVKTLTPFIPAYQMIKGNKKLIESEYYIRVSF
jgi:hypothetical protein